MVVPFVGLFVVPLGLLSSILTLTFDLNGLPLPWLNQFVLDALASVVGFLAKIPGAEWHVASPAVFAIVGFYGFLLLTRLSKTAIIRYVSAVVVVGCIVWWVWSPRQLWTTDTLRTTFLDVGQGDATLLELPDGQTVLIDGGAAYERWDMGRMVVGPYLWDQGIRTIDHLIATHPQLDHVGGLTWVIKHFDIRNFWTNGIQRVEPFYQRLNQAVRTKHLNPEIAWAGLDLDAGDFCRIRFLNPPRSQNHNTQTVVGAASGAELNNLSIVLSVTCGRHSLLLPADAEVETLERIGHNPAVQAASLVKIPHHGAKSSFNADWIDQLTAKVAVVSAGQQNRYGHPIPTVMKAYERKGMALYRTDQDGAVIVTQRVDSLDTTIHTTQEQSLSLIRLESNFLGQEIRNLQRILKKWTGIN